MLFSGYLAIFNFTGMSHGGMSETDMGVGMMASGTFLEDPLYRYTKTNVF